MEDVIQNIFWQKKKKSFPKFLSSISFSYTTKYGWNIKSYKKIHYIGRKDLNPKTSAQSKRSLFNKRCAFLKFRRIHAIDDIKQLATTSTLENLTMFQEATLTKDSRIIENSRGLGAQKGNILNQSTERNTPNSRAYANFVCYQNNLGCVENNHYLYIADPPPLPQEE